MVEKVSQPASHVAVAIRLYAKASSLKNRTSMLIPKIGGNWYGMLLPVDWLSGASVYLATAVSCVNGR